MTASNNQQGDDIQNLHSKIEHMDQEIKKSQQDLAESLKTINTHIEEQRLTATRDEAVQWNNLQEEVAEEIVAVDRLKEVQDQMQGSLTKISNLSTDVGGLTGNRQFQELGSKVGYFGRLSSTICSMLPKESTKGRSTTPQYTQNPDAQPRRQRLKPVPPMPAIPPPQRVRSSQQQMGNDGSTPSPWGDRQPKTFAPGTTSVNRNSTSPTWGRSVAINTRSSREEESEEARPVLPPRPLSSSPSSVHGLTKSSPPPLPPRKLTEATLDMLTVSGAVSPVSPVRTTSPESPPRHASDKSSSNACSNCSNHAVPPQDRRSSLAVSQSGSKPIVRPRGPKPVLGTYRNSAVKGAQGTSEASETDNSGISTVRQRAMFLESQLKLVQQSA
jgi:hypothetical protein